MEISQTLYVTDREHWRTWLAENYKSAKEIWLVYYKKESGKPRIPYNDAVEEALCFGWIDSTVKALNKESYVQRFSPRRKSSRLSELNKERIRFLIREGKMTEYGLDSIRHHLEEHTDELAISQHLGKFELAEDILKALQANPVVWNNYEKFPDQYKHIRIGFIEGARSRPDEFNKRLQYFIKMTAKNKKYGMVQ